MSINSAILHIICYNEDLNCSIFCKVDDNLVALLVVTLTRPWSKIACPCSEILLSPQKTPLARRPVQSCWLFISSCVYACLPYLSSHLLELPCPGGGGHVRTPSLWQLCGWVGRSLLPPSALQCIPSSCCVPPWGAEGWARVSFPLKSIKSRRRSQRFLSGTFLGEAPLCGVVTAEGLLACSSWNLRKMMELVWAGPGLAGRTVLPWLLGILPFTCRDEDQGV